MTPRGRGGERPVQSEAGVIVSHRGVAVEVELSSGSRELVRVKRRSGHVVGDRVRVSGERLTREERDNQLRRRSPGGGVHVVCANLDVLLIVVAVEPPARTGLIDRAIVAARSQHIEPLVVVNKVDLDGGAALAERLAALYAGAGVRVLVASAERGDGLDALAAAIADAGRAAFAGHSGVGKSSLTNRLVPAAELGVSHLSEASGKGRHTTTVATLHRLPDGGELVDTPGIKEFGLVEVEPADVAACFPGLDALAPGDCRFRNCLHKGEPGCALDTLVDDGTVTTERVDAYRALLREVETGEDPRA
jgi:ribosome biogenesis GTPase